MNKLHESCDLSAEEFKKLEEAKTRMWHLKKVRDNYTFQKTRVQWIHERDVNSSYFQNSIKKIRWSKKIDGLTIDGVWVEDIEIVK